MKCLSQILALIMFLLTCLSLNAQKVSKVYQDYELFKDGKVQSPATYALTKDESQNIHVTISDKGLGFNLTKVNILSEDFFVETSQGGVITDVDGTFYQGTLDNDSTSIATLSMYKNEVVLSYSNKDGNFEVTGEKQKPYTMRRIPSNRAIPFECHTTDTILQNSTAESNVVGCRVIQIYFEADYKLYQDKGSSVVNTTNYITALFNQIALLYNNEQISVQISQIKVWNTPDPYIQYTNTGSVLSAFRTTLGPNFNGNLAHFLSTRPLGGGIAYLDVLCLKTYAFGVSAISTVFQNIPTYSWSVEVVTHELGHNIGSWHTQSCNWPGGALDNCYYTEGGCPAGPAPVNGGTIMSYCHLTGYGINFVNGFGPVPGNHIRNKFNSAACLTGTSNVPSGLQTTSITNTSATLQWLAVGGTLSYTLQYKQVNSQTWTTVNVGLNTTYVLSGLLLNTQYHWQVRTNCSSYTAPVVFTTTGQVTCNLALTPAFTSITQTSVFIYWVPLSGASYYVLQYKQVNATNWIEYSAVSSNVLSLGGLQPNTTYIVRVRPNCNSNFGPTTQFTTLSNGGNCPPPSGLQTLNITTTSATFSWQAQSIATGYQLGFKFPNTTNWITFGAIFNSTAAHIYGLQPNSTYQWRVKNQCSTWSNVMTFTTMSLLVEPDGFISPNPNNGTFRLDNVFGNGILVNLIGTKVGEFILDGTEINIQNLPSGIYYLKVENKVYKVIKI